MRVIQPRLKSPDRSENAIRYVANPSHVREVSLTATADYSFWQSKLAREGFIPASRNGRALMTVTGATMKFAGIRFSELSVCVQLLEPGKKGSAGDLFLLQAFNSSRVFAFCERVLFATPYLHGTVLVDAHSPEPIRVEAAGKTVLLTTMQMAPGAVRREPVRRGEEQWSGRVFLPGKHNGGTNVRRYFFAKLQGHTCVYPFECDHDSCEIFPSSDCSLIRDLLDSNFTPDEWLIREDATHGKSRTYRLDPNLSDR